MISHELTHFMVALRFFAQLVIARVTCQGMPMQLKTSSPGVVLTGVDKVCQDLGGIILHHPKQGPWYTMADLEHHHTSSICGRLVFCDSFGTLLYA